ncbi:MAG: glycosyltransferase family 2 protein [Candidatus Nanoarchaeia archaeon]|nr:glycosyltransferase family 2 protein [Candidatus Nanoarchaeia archaeon]
MKNILISIIIPTYNRKDKIERAINSVLKQTYKNWELIIVDDGSTDGTQESIKRYLKNKKIKYYYKKNGGVSSARNFGMKKATGKYIAFLDSDDEFLKNKLEVQLNEMIENNVEFSICNSIEFTGKKKKIFEEHHNSFIFDQNFFIKNKIPISASFFVFKKNNLLFNEELYTSDDYDFLMRYLVKNKILFVKNILNIRYRYFDNIRLSVNTKLKIKDLIKCIKILKINDYQLNEKIKKTRLKNLYLSLGFWYLFENKFKQGRHLIQKGLKLEQKFKINIYYRLLYYLSFSPTLFKLIKKIALHVWEK